MGGDGLVERNWFSTGYGWVREMGWRIWSWGRRVVGCRYGKGGVR